MERLHVAFIMDGNRRWAVEKGLPKTAGHKYGAETLKKILECSKELDFRMVTLYTFSMENFNRSDKEKEVIFDLFRKFFGDLDKLLKEDVRVRFLGSISLFPEDIREMVQKIERDTANGSGIQVNFCFGYGGRQEIVDACNRAIKAGKEVTSETFGQFLYLDDEPEMVIRTGGAIRTSNFLPWQTAYSEWYFPEEYWPAFTKERLISLVGDFRSRKRNFGK